MDLKRPSCHEAGHTLVALYFGFRVEGIEVFEGRLQTMCQLDAEDRTDKERFIFLAGGIAGEKSELATMTLAAAMMTKRKSPSVAGNQSKRISPTLLESSGRTRNVSES